MTPELDRPHLCPREQLRPVRWVCVKARGTAEARGATEVLPLSPWKTFSPRNRLQTVNGGLEESKPDTGTREYLGNVTLVRDPRPRLSHFSSVEVYADSQSASV